MKFKPAFKFDMVSALRLLLYYAVAIISLLLSRVMGSVILSVIFCTVSIAFFTMLFSKNGIITILPSLLPIVLIGFTESVISAMSAFIIVIVSASFGLSLRKRLRPVETVLITSAVFLVFSLCFAVVENVMSSGYFSIKESVSRILTLLDNTIAGVADAYKTTTGYSISNLGYISSTLKAILVGLTLSSYISATCFYYFLTMLIAKIIREKDVYSEKKSFEIMPSRASAWVFIVCVFISLFFTATSANVRFYTHLPTNIMIILSPLFIFAGIYYLFNIKYKVEHASPVFTIIVIIASLLFGLIQIIPVYIAFSGITYTLRYGEKNGIKPTNDSQ